MVFAGGRSQLGRVAVGLAGASLLAFAASGTQLLPAAQAEKPLAGVPANGMSTDPAINLGGRFVAFSSTASNLVTGDTNGKQDVFVRDRNTGTTERVSVSSAEKQGDGDSAWAAISADGRFVAFHSYAADLVAGDTNHDADVFVRDRTTGTTTRVSVTSTGRQANTGSGSPLDISADGRFVAFDSEATNLVARDTNGARDVFVRDRTTGTTERISVIGSGAQWDTGSYVGAISADGRIVTFYGGGVFARDRKTGTTGRVSVGRGGRQARFLLTNTIAWGVAIPLSKQSCQLAVLPT